MFYIRIADLNVQSHNIYPFVKEFCKDYLISPVSNPDIVVHTTNEEIKRELELEDANMPIPLAEGICVYRKICLELPKKFQGFLMHCAVIEYKGEGYAFSAKSGTGKSTHIRFWQKRFGEEVHIVNGDKPIMRFIDNRLVAYGTPWCGKEGYQTNMSVPLKAICFIERAEKNRIRPLTSAEIVSKIFPQILTPADVETVDTLFPMLDRLIRDVPCYMLGCNMSEEAAEVAYHGTNQIV